MRLRALRATLAAVTSALLVAGLLAAAGSAASADPETGIISGIVTDASGRPVPDVAVSAYAAGSSYGDDRGPLAGNPSGSAVTDAQGRYTLEAKVAPTFVVVQLPSYFSTTYAGNTSRWQDARRIDLNSETPTSADIVMIGLPPTTRGRPIISRPSGSAFGIFYPLLVVEDTWFGMERVALNDPFYYTGKPVALNGPFSYQWYWVDGAQRIPIPGATGRNYTPTPADLHRSITVVVSLSYAGSAPTSVEAFGPFRPLYVSTFRITSYRSPAKNTIRLSGTVAVRGVPRPTGKARAYCITSDGKQYKSRPTSVKNGKVTIKLKTKKIKPKKGKRATAQCSMTYGGNPDIERDATGVTKKFTVRKK